MSQQIIQGAKVYLNSLRIDTALSALALSAMADTVECTTLADTWKKRKPSTLDLACEMNGYVDFDDANNDDRIFTDLGATNVPIMIGPLAGAAGEPAYFFRALEASYKCLGKYGDMAPFDLSAQGHDTPLVRGKMLTNAARTSSSSGTVYDYGTPPVTARLHAQLQCYALTASGGSPTLTVKVQFSVDNTFAAAVNELTFSALAAVGAQHAEFSADDLLAWSDDGDDGWTDDADAGWGFTENYHFRAAWTLADITTTSFAVSAGYTSQE